MRRICVSGGAGFIGSHLIHHLVEQGEYVDILDNYATGTRDNLRSVLRKTSARFTTYEHDVTEPVPEPVRTTPYDIVIHLASRAAPPAYQAAPIATLRAGSVGTRRMLELARAHDATFVLASTSEVYGDPEEHPQTESYHGNVNPVGPRACYDESKRYAEAFTHAYHETYGVDTRIARIFNTYGPRMRDGRVIPTFIRQALAGDPLTVHGDGTQTRSFCYVSDLIDGLLALIERGGPDPVNLGNPEEVTIQELAERLTSHVDGHVKITHTERPEDDPDRRRPDISRAREMLDWEPNVPLQDGLAKTTRSVI